MYERATSVMGGGPPLSVFFFLFFPLPPRMDRGARGRKHLVSKKKKKTTEEGAGLEGERREEEEGFTVPGVAQILRQRNAREKLR